MGILSDNEWPDDAGPPQVRLDWVTPDDWSDLRTVRLRALADAPDAFASEPSREASWLERDWRSVMEQAQWVVARTAQDIIGVARSSQDAQSPGRRYIEAVWVAPEFRRLGVGSGLVRWLIERELNCGAQGILLWVIDSNGYARDFYIKIGFRPTGELQPVPGHKDKSEELFAYEADLK